MRRLLERAGEAHRDYEVEGRLRRKAMERAARSG